jgi:hypothetical protein
MYLYHLPIYYLLLNYAPRRSHYFYGAVVLAGSLLAAAGSWKLLESPIIHGTTPGARILTHVTRVTRGWGQRHWTAHSHPHSGTVSNVLWMDFLLGILLLIVLAGVAAVRAVVLVSVAAVRAAVSHRR